MACCVDQLHRESVGCQSISILGQRFVLRNVKNFMHYQLSNAAVMFSNGNLTIFAELQWRHLSSGLETERWPGSQG